MIDIVESFIQACVDGNVIKAQEILELNLDLNIEESRWKLIESICKSNKVDTFKWLLGKFKCFNNKNNLTKVMTIALDFNCTEIMYFMIDNYDFENSFYWLRKILSLNIFDCVRVNSSSYDENNLDLARKIIDENKNIITGMVITDLYKRALSTNISSLSYVKYLFDNIPEAQVQVPVSCIFSAIKLDSELTKYLLSFSYPKKENQFFKCVNHCIRYNKLDIAKLFIEKCRYEYSVNKLSEKWFLCAAKDLKLDALKWLHNLFYFDKSTIRSCFETIGFSINKDNLDLDLLVTVIDWFDNICPGLILDENKEKLITHFYRHYGLQVGEVLITKFGLDQSNINLIISDAVKYFLDNGEITLANELLEKYPNIKFEVKTRYYKAIENNNIKTLEYLHQSNYCKTAKLKWNLLNKSVNLALKNLCDMSIEWLYANVPNFKIGIDKFSILCKRCRKPSDDANTRTLQLRIIKIMAQYDDRLEANVVDNIVKSYRVNIYKETLKELFEGKYADIIKRFGIEQHDYNLKCCVCEMTHDNIIQLPCRHCICLEELLKSYRGANDEECFCTQCREIYPWDECISITSKFNGMRTKSARN